jgi:ATP-dependent helicase/nuclease subunit A
LAPEIPVGDGGASELRTAEARTVAALLHRVVAEGWPVWDRRDGKKRKIGYGDVGILFRAKEAMDLYEEEFRDFEIPYRVAGGRRYYSRQEMGALLAVLSAIDNPKDRVALTAALRCAFFSASDEELFLFAHSGLALDYLEAGAETAGMPESIRNAFRLLRELHALRNQMPVPLFILKLYEASRIVPFFYLKPQGDQKAANLLKVVEMARALARQGLVTLRSFVQFLKKMEAAEAEEGESPLAEESENVARLMTIHKAKGLEFPLVILADAAYQSRRRMGEGIVNRQEGHLEIRLGNRTVGISTQGWQAEGEKERLREEAEDSRLLYVAATRAREYLVTPFVPGDKKRFLGPLWGNLGIDSEIPWGEKLYPYERGGPAVWVYDSRKLDVEKKELKPFRIGVEAKRRRARSRSLQQFRSWEQALRQIHESGRRTEKIMAASAVVKETERPDLQWAWAQRHGPIFGSFVHDLFYHIDLRRPDGLETMALTLGKKYALKEAEADRAVELVRWGLSSGVLTRAARSERVWRELPFVCHEQGSVIEGYIDLAFEEDGELVVVDFKTDEVKSEKELDEKARHYAPQGLVYARSLEKIARKKVKEVVLLFLSAQAEKSIPHHQPTIGQ